MWGSCYWGRPPAVLSSGGSSEDLGGCGIVVLFSWLSCKERHLRPYFRLYESLGWACLVCRSDFLTLFFPDMAQSLADSVIEELVKPLKIKQVPVVFASFSGGPKGCTYKVLQLVEKKCKGRLSQEDYQLVRECLAGQIYDSCPVDFTSEFGTKFVLHPSVTKMSQPPRALSVIAKGLSSVLDTIFINRFEAHRAEYWHTLYSSANVGPVLIICSADDELAPYEIVREFAERLQELGSDVNLMKLDNSPHVGHYKHHPEKYRAAVEQLLGKAASHYVCRRRNVVQSKL